MIPASTRLEAIRFSRIDEATVTRRMKVVCSCTRRCRVDRSQNGLVLCKEGNRTDFRLLMTSSFLLAPISTPRDNLNLCLCRSAMHVRVRRQCMRNGFKLEPKSPLRTSRGQKRQSVELSFANGRDNRNVDLIRPSRKLESLDLILFFDQNDQ